MTSVFSWQNSISLCPASFRIPRPNFPVTPDTVHGILQARILEWVAFSFSRASSQPRVWTQVSCIAEIWHILFIIFWFLIVTVFNHQLAKFLKISQSALVNQFESALACDCLWHLPMPPPQYPIHQPIYWFYLLNISSSRLSSLHLHGHLDCYRTLVCLPDIQQNQSTVTGFWWGKIQCLFAGHQARRTRSSCSKDPNYLLAYMQGFLKTTLELRVAGYVIGLWPFFWLVGDKVIFQEFQSSVFWLQPVWSLSACSQHVIHTFHLVEGSVLGSAKQPKDIGQDISYSSWGGTKCLVSDLWLNCCSGYYYFPCLTACPLLYIFSFL